LPRVKQFGPPKFSGIQKFWAGYGTAQQAKYKLCSYHIVKFLSVKGFVSLKSVQQPGRYCFLFFQGQPKGLPGGEMVEFRFTH